MLAGTVTVGTAPTLVCLLGSESDGAIVQNNGNATVILGGSTVTASGDTAGISLAAGATLTIPGVRGAPQELYGIIESGTSAVAFLVPA